MTTTQEPVAAETHGTHRMTTAKAVAEGIASEMRRDPSVVYLGEDVGAYGGIFGATGGLLDEFGPSRIIDTPISETAFVGLGIGAAVEGMRPIVEVMFTDFMGVCLDQIYNHMAKIHYESGGNVSVPMVVTMAAGGGYSDAEQHSQCLWGTLAHLPGMKVVAPSNPYDAKGLMISAIRDDSPVVYVFHKGVMGLAWMARNDRAVADVPDEAYTVPIGEAAVCREGTDVTLVTISRSVHHALDVAERLAAEQLSVEVVDLRSLVPLDRPTILASVAKTGRLVVVDEDYRSFGMSGEVVATVTDVDPRLLHAPAIRVANPDTPIAYSRPLEQAILPMPDRIETALRRVLAT